MQKADIELADLSQASDQDIKLKDGKVLGETDSEEDEVVIETVGVPAGFGFFFFLEFSMNLGKLSTLLTL